MNKQPQTCYVEKDAEPVESCINYNVTSISEVGNFGIRKSITDVFIRLTKLESVYIHTPEELEALKANAAIDFKKWLDVYEDEINNREQRTHTLEELYYYFNQPETLPINTTFKKQ